MGHSPSADLFWGYNLGDLTDHDTFDDLRPDWMDGNYADVDEVLARRLGWVEAPYPNNIADPPHSLPYEERRRIQQEQRDTPEFRTWSESRSNMRRVVATVPVELVTYGYGEEPSYCVRVKASVQRAHDWGSTPVEPLSVQPEWAQQLAEFMRILEFPAPADPPGWHMNCSYG